MPVRRRAHELTSQTPGKIGLYGPRRLSDLELLASLLAGKDSVAAALLAHAGSLYALSRLGVHPLCEQGLSPQEASRLVACLELGRRAAIKPAPPGAVLEPRDAYSCVAGEFAGAERERFVAVILDAKNRPRHIATIALGSVDSCPVDPREVFGVVLRERGTAVLVAHNHPSGDPSPSHEDLLLTDRLVQAGRLLGVPLVDHLILGGCSGDEQDGSWVSLAQRGVVPAAQATGRTLDPRVA